MVSNKFQITFGLYDSNNKPKNLCVVLCTPCIITPLAQHTPSVHHHSSTTAWGREADAGGEQNSAACASNSNTLHRHHHPMSGVYEPGPSNFYTAWSTANESYENHSVAIATTQFEVFTNLFSSTFMQLDLDGKRALLLAWTTTQVTSIAHTW